MKMKLLFIPVIVAAAFFLVSCGGKDKKGNDDKITTETTTKSSGNNDDGMVPVIDTASLKDEASILAALEKVVDARIADAKKRKEDPAYHSHIMELMALHTNILQSSHTFYKSFSDREKALEYGKKFDAIESKLHTAQ